jgi:amino acid transporter
MKYKVTITIIIIISIIIIVIIIYICMYMFIFRNIHDSHWYLRLLPLEKVKGTSPGHPTNLKPFGSKNTKNTPYEWGFFWNIPKDLKISIY